MKKTLSSLILLAVALSGFSQPRKYRKSMEKAFASVEQAVTPGDFTACATSFGEIAEGYPELWMPPYYAAYCLVTSTFESSDYTSKTEALKQAGIYVQQVKKLNPEESETEALRAYHALGMMAADPESNGPLYLEEFTYSIERAKKLNPENPRPYYMDGLLKANLPEFMGGGTAVAKLEHQTAAQKFEAFQNDDPFWPRWGASQNQQQLNGLQ